MGACLLTLIENGLWNNSSFPELLFATLLRIQHRDYTSVEVRAPMKADNDFRFGIEAEFLLVDASSFRPLWYRDLNFQTLNAALEEIPADDFQCDSFKLEPPPPKGGTLHRRRIPFA